MSTQFLPSASLLSLGPSWCGSWGLQTLLLITRSSAWDVTWFLLFQGNCALVVEFLALGCLVRGICVRAAALAFPSQTMPHMSAQSTDRAKSPLPGPGQPVPMVPPSVFQGPRFMTSEYNSKYLKEPSNWPGGCLSELTPPSHHTSLPLTPGETSRGPELAQH